MIVTPAEMRAIEDAAFAGGATAEALMDAVGQRIADHVRERVPPYGATLLIYAGKGNNAGDAFVVAKAVGPPDPRWTIRLRLAQDDPTALGELARKKLDDLPLADFPRVTADEARAACKPGGRLFIIDGLLGIGAKGELRDPIRSAAREINALRRARGAYVIAIDTPTGLDAETGVADTDAVVADETFTVGFPKTGLLVDRATDHVGRLSVIELPEFTGNGKQAPDASARGALTTPASLAGLLPPRPHESNKGMYGRVGILAGSVGATGAAVMCAHACARAGAGLITLLAHPDIYPIVAAAASPEIMVNPLASPTDALEMDFDLLALGPGLGKQGGDKVRALIERWPKPMVVDADGLNALSEDVGLLKCAAGPRLLTPHPGEMKRLLKGDAVARGGVFNDHASRADIVQRVHRTVSRHAAAQGSAHADWRRGTRAGLQFHRQRRDGDRRHGRCADGPVRGAGRAKIVALRRGACRRVAARTRRRPVRVPGRPVRGDTVAHGPVRPTRRGVPGVACGRRRLTRFPDVDTFSSETLVPLLMQNAGLLLLVLPGLVFYGFLTDRTVFENGGKVRAEVFGWFDGLAALLVVGLFVGLILTVLTYSSQHPEAITALPDASQMVAGIVENEVIYLAIPAAFLAAMKFRGIGLRAAFGVNRLGVGAVFGWAFLLVVLSLPLIDAATELSRVLLAGVGYRNEDKQDMVRFLAENRSLAARLVVAVSAVIFAPFQEEMIFRGYIYGVARRYGGPLAGMVCTSLLFAAIHLHAPSFAGLFVLAMCLTLAYEWTGSLFVPMLMHAMFNSITVVNLLVGGSAQG